MKRTSLDPNFSLVVDMASLEIHTNPRIFNVRNFVACNYDQKWYVGIIKESDKLNQDYFVKFMPPHGPSQSFVWPIRNDVCWLPPQHIICIVGSRSLMSSRGQYKLAESDVDKILLKL